MTFSARATETENDGAPPAGQANPVGPAAEPGDRDASSARELLLATTGRLTMLAGLFWDVGLSLAGYYGLRLAGVSEWIALLGGAAAAGSRIVWVAVRNRRLNAFATVMLLVFGLGVLFAVVGGDPRFLLLKDSATTGVIGLTFVVTTAVGRPLTLAAIQSWQPRNATAIAQLYDERPPARHGFRLSAYVWGAGLVAEALVRVPLVYLLSIDVVVGLSAVLMTATIVSLIVWNGWYIRQTVHRLDSE